LGRWISKSWCRSWNYRRAIFLCKKYHKPYLWVLDRIAIVVALAGFLIRMGNLMNSEIFGDVTTLPWGFVFVRYFGEGYTLAHHPTQNI